MSHSHNPHDSRSGFDHKESVLYQQIDQMSSLINICFKSIVDKIPHLIDEKTGKSVINADIIIRDFILHCIQPTEDFLRLQKLIHNTSLIAAKTLQDSFQEILSTLPMCTLEDNKPPTQQREIPIVLNSQLPQYNWEDKSVRVAYITLIDRIISEFFLRMLLTFEEQSHQPDAILKQISDVIFELLFPKTSIPILTYSRMANSDNWASIVHILSKFIPKYWSYFFVSKLPTPKDSQSELFRFFEVFKWIYISVESELRMKDLPGIINPIVEILKKSKLDPFIRNSGIDFLKNLMGYLLTFQIELRRDDLIYNVYAFTKSFKDKEELEGSNRTLRSVVCNFSDHKRMNTPMVSNISKNIIVGDTIDPKLSQYILECFSITLRGRNWQSPCEHQFNGERFKWTPEENQKDIVNLITTKIIENSKAFHNSQKELAETLLQIAAIDFTGFIKSRLKSFLDIEFLQDNTQAIFLFSVNVLSPQSFFLSSIPEFEQSTVDSFKAEILNSINFIFDHTSIQPGNAIYTAQSMIETINLATPIHRPNASYTKLQEERAIYDLLQTSSPLHVSLISPPKLLPKIIPTMIPREYRSVLISDLHKDDLNIAEVRDFQPYAFHGGVYLPSVLSVIPYLDINDTLVAKLVPFIFSEDIEIASITLRLLQVLIIKNPKLLSKILNLIFIKSEPMSVEYLYNEIQAITQLLEAGFYVHSVLSSSEDDPSRTQDTVSNIFQLIIIGLCSNYPVIRKLTFNLIDMMKIIANKQEPNMSSFLDSEGDEIAAKLSHQIVGLFNCDSKVDTSNIKQIDFKVIATSNSDCLYFFALSQFSQQLVSLSKLNEETDFSKFIGIIESLKTKSSNFYINLMIFLSGLRFNKQTKIIQDNEKDFLEAVMKNSGEYIDLPIIAFFTAMKPELAQSLITEHKLSDNTHFNQAYSAILRHLFQNFDLKNENIILKHCITMLYEVQDIFIKEQHQRHQLKVTKRSSLNISIPVSSKTTEDHLVFEVIPGDELKKDLQLQLYLNNILSCLHLILTKQFTNQSKESISIYPLSKCVDKGEENNETVKIFTILFNITFLDKTAFPETKELACKALASFTRVNHIPNSLFMHIIDRLDDISNNSFHFLVNLLTENIDKGLGEVWKYFAVNSIENPIFFDAISDQFEKIPLEELASNIKRGIAAEKATGKLSEVTNFLFSETGFVIAYALFNICNTSTTERKSGYHVLLSVLIPSILINDPDYDLSETITKLAAIKKTLFTNDLELIENYILSITRSLVKPLSFCVEQLLSASFSIIAQLKTPCPLFTTCLLPFFSLLTFGLSQGITKYKQHTTCFSTYTFFQTLINKVIPERLTPETIQILDQVLSLPNEQCKPEDFFVHIVFKLQPTVSQSCSESKYRSVLKFLTTRVPSTVTDVISNYFRFKGWFYYNVQINKLDQQLDLNFLINANKDTSPYSSTTNNNLNTSDATKEPDAAQTIEQIYDSTITFSLNFLIDIFSIPADSADFTFFKNNRKHLRKILYIALLFCILNYTHYHDLAQSLFGVFDRCFRSQIPIGDVFYDQAEISKLAEYCGIRDHHTITTLDLILHFFSSLDSAQLADLSMECISWALTCGEFTISLPAAQLSVHLISRGIIRPEFFDPEELSSTIIRTLEIVFIAASEKRDETKFAWLRLFDQDKDDGKKHAKLEHYLAATITLLQRSLEWLPQLPDSVMNFALSSLRCHSQKSIILASLSLLDYIISDGRFPCASYAERFSQPGILRDLLAVDHTRESLDLAVDVVIALIQSGSIRLLTDGPPEFLLLSHLPVLWWRHQLEDVSEAVAMLTEALGEGPAATAIGAAEWGKPADIAAAVVPPCMKAIGKLGEKEAKKLICEIIGFYTTVYKATDSALLESIVACSAQILKESKQCANFVPIEALGEIAYKAARDLREGRKGVMTEFLTLFRVEKGKVRKPATKTKTDNSPLPKVEFGEPFAAADWAVPLNDEGAQVDCFVQVGLLPPMAIIDLDFCGTPSQGPVYGAAQSVKTQPFTGWSDEIFVAENALAEMESQVEQKIELPDGDCKCLKSIEASAEKEKDIEVSAAFTKEEKRDEEKINERVVEKIEGEEGEMLKFEGLEWMPRLDEIEIKTSRFLPAKEDVDELGKDELAELNFPTLF